MREFLYWHVRRPLFRLGLWLVWRLPRGLCYWCALRVMAHATVGKWGHESPSDVTLFQVLDRWGEKNP